MCTALVVGNMIGSGIFLLPASLAPYGWNAIFGWGLTIAGGLALALVFANLSRALPKAGGPFAYTRDAFGAAPAFFVAWSYWISLWVGNAALATGAVSYLSVFFPSITEVEGQHAAITISAIWGLTAINCRGAFLAGNVQVITTVLKVLPLFGVIFLGAVIIGKEGAEAVKPLHAYDLRFSSITAAATLTLWALLGLESATIPAEQVKAPSRTIPRATILGMVIAGVIYLLSCSAIILLSPAEQVAASSAPFADFVANYWGDDAGKLIAIFAAISGFGALNGWILLQGEVPFAMAKGGVFPKWLAKTSKHGTPVRAHVTTSFLLTVLVLLNYSKSTSELFTLLLLIATTASLVMFLVTSLAAIKLQLSKRIQSTRLFYVVAVAAAVYAVWTIYGAGARAIIWGLGLLLAGVPVYLIVRRTSEMDS